MNVNRLREKRQAVTLNKKKHKTSETKIEAYDAINDLLGRANSSTPLKIPVSLKENSHTQSASISRKNPVNDANRHAPRTSQILMRSSVQKPGLGFKRHLKISGSTNSFIDATPVVVEPLQLNVAVQQALRNQRAASFKQSERISHFVPPPAQAATKPVTSDDQSWQPAPQTIPPPPPKSPADRVLERGLNQATAHEQPLLKRAGSKRRRFSLISIPVAAVVVALFIGGHGLTKIQLQVASAKVGFHTSLPAYQPAGFGLGQLSYSSNIFASEFQSKNNTQGYTVTQQSTPWTSQDLLDNYIIVNNGNNYQTVHVGDRTIYLYGVGAATWVSGGIWYQINSDGSLNDSQLIGVANSL